MYLHYICLAFCYRYCTNTSVVGITTEPFITANLSGERETGKVTMTQCATHMLHHLFLSLYVVWWHGVQPTHCIIYFIPSLLFDDAVCNPHTASSISFSPCFLMMQHATHMPCQLFLSLHVVWWHDMQPTCCVIYLIPSMLFDDVACNPHATSSISFYFYSYIYS